MRRALIFLAPRAGLPSSLWGGSIRKAEPRAGNPAPLDKQTALIPSLTTFDRQRSLADPPHEGEGEQAVNASPRRHRLRSRCRLLSPVPPTLPTTRTDLDAAGSRPRRGDHQADHRLLQARTVRADAGRRGHVAEARQPGRFLAFLRQHHLRGRRHLQARQRAVPQSSGCRRPPRRRPPTGSGRCSTPAPARAAI